MRIVRTILSVFSPAILLVLPQPASAAYQWCTGSVLSSWMRADGSVHISSSWMQGNHTQICNIKTEWKTITPDVCVAWLAKLDAAASMNKTVTIFYWDAPTCDVLPHYEAAPPPAYVMILNS